MRFNYFSNFQPSKTLKIEPNFQFSCAHRLSWKFTTFVSIQQCSTKKALPEYQKKVWGQGGGEGARDQNLFMSITHVQPQNGCTEKDRLWFVRKLYTGAIHSRLLLEARWLRCRDIMDRTCFQRNVKFGHGFKKSTVTSQRLGLESWDGDF